MSKYKFMAKLRVSIRGCWADNAEIPIQCSHDTGEEYNCAYAGIKNKTDCPYWSPAKTRRLIKRLSEGFKK